MVVMGLNALSSITCFPTSEALNQTDRAIDVSMPSRALPAFRLGFYVSLYYSR